MTHRKLKIGYFTLEGLNSFATTYYLYYFYFYMQQVFGFGNRANLALAALNGAIYAVASVYAGRFAQKHGYFLALKVGFAGMLCPLLLGSLVHSPAAHIVIMGFTVFGMCFTWPTLEALVSEDEGPAGLQRMVGIYNIAWAATGALAYFIGGALLQKLGLKSLFLVPVAIQAIQLGLTFWLEAAAQKEKQQKPSSIVVEAADAEIAAQPLAVRKSFLKMAWLANPFAYIAINTTVAVIPSIASKFGLSTMMAGFLCSIWTFSRLGAFVALWNWSGWHFKFSWLLWSYVGLILTFAAILMVPNLAVLIAAQVLFGMALGLIYYSSLFYSMHGSDTKSEHGGIHEAAIGVGNCAGPAVGALSIYFLPQFANSGAMAVSGLLLAGLGGLLVLRAKS
jgi:predicted MFS family arabinose efflux permease